MRDLIIPNIYKSWNILHDHKVLFDKYIEHVVSKSFKVIYYSDFGNSFTALSYVADWSTLRKSRTHATIPIDLGW